MTNFIDANQAVNEMLQQFSPYQIQKALSNRLGLEHVKEMVQELEYFDK